MTSCPLMLISPIMMVGHHWFPRVAATQSIIPESPASLLTSASSSTSRKGGPMRRTWVLPESASKLRKLIPSTPLFGIGQSDTLTEKRLASHSKTAPTTHMLVINDELHSHLYPLGEYSTLFSAQAGARVKIVRAYRNSTTGNNHRYLAFPCPKAKHDPPGSVAEFNSLWDLVTKGKDGTEKVKITPFFTAEWDLQSTGTWMT
jgi:hypothetical protein